MGVQTVKLSLQIEQSEGNTDEIDRVTRQLHSEIEEFAVDSIELATSAPARPGTKSVDAVVLGGLIVAVGPTLLTKFLEFLHAWAMRHENQTIKIKIQAEDGVSIEVDIPSTMSSTELKSRIRAITEVLPRRVGNLSTRGKVK